MLAYINLDLDKKSFDFLYYCWFFLNFKYILFLSLDISSEMFKIKRDLSFEKVFSFFVTSAFLKRIFNVRFYGFPDKTLILYFNEVSLVGNFKKLYASDYNSKIKLYSFLYDNFFLNICQRNLGAFLHSFTVEFGASLSFILYLVIYFTFYEGSISNPKVNNLLI